MNRHSLSATPQIRVLIYRAYNTLNMNNDKNWNMASARLAAFGTNPPHEIDEARVDEYHSILDALEEATQENLAVFRIPAEEMKPKLIRTQAAAYGGGFGFAEYSKNKYCDKRFFLRQYTAAMGYLKTLRDDVVGQGVGYHALNHAQLRELEVKYRIKPKKIVDSRGEHFLFDREHVIKELEKRDSARTSSPSQPTHVVHVQNMYGSNIQQGTQGSNVTINYTAKETELRSVLNKVQRSIDELQLTADAKSQLRVDIGTVQVQLSSPNPKTSIVAESLRSMRAILENAAGSLIASGLAFEISKYLGGN